MCILFLTRSHPDYELILISNRDEFLQRKTAFSCWNERSNCEVLCPYDLSRNETDPSKFGTWCGINEFGRVSSVLNLKMDENKVEDKNVRKKSRGYLPVKFLDNRKENSFNDWNSYSKFLKQYPDLEKTGSFNLFIGDVKKQEYALIDSFGQTKRILDGKDENGKSSVVISNSEFISNDKERWHKISNGEKLMDEFLSKDIRDENSVIESCFKIASTSELTNEYLHSHDDILDLMTETVFVPPIKLENPVEKDNIGASLPVGKFYGTRSQIVILVNKERTTVRYMERVLYECDDDVSKAGIEKPINELNFEYNIL
ncbi:hypothetical protein TPHA_0D03260 [Tetrapisispora phaffii CBS 4417]|uniref:Transport and Golgi organization protein 2 n=1 Tax=Tetrapisispora phaffii (strain ATCC 24235 / CBS 4417 / NBRC 1672 / NRRL Y-8282 / UCD 70-5) TaxID=1071381 RepID=G8BSZ1_TETPH|nr:hypothetical protein TPHA_0D03260 [Tetrapisispora phaffii CBS 4417]CCE62962.1 hypothetical protein TPHA_0D03260 [Tetrapisispora phaffii CBS 4417]